MDDWEQELGRAIGDVQTELAKSEQHYEELWTDYQKLKEKVREYISADQNYEVFRTEEDRIAKLNIRDKVRELVK